MATFIWVSLPVLSHSQGLGELPASQPCGFANTVAWHRRHKYSDRRGSGYKAGEYERGSCWCSFSGQQQHSFTAQPQLTHTELLLWHTLSLLQESVKTRHPQLLYESKLYKILQGGGGCWA